MKKKATIIILTAILLGSFYNEIYSQEYYFNPNRNVVIASSGLNMRTKPNTSAEKLVNIPYGEKVKILHRDHYGLDTVYTIKSELQDHPVYGYWQKVEYQGHVGYVHNAFLKIQFDYRTSHHDNKNENYLLLMPGYDCSEVFYNSSEYFWYGYYQEQDSFGFPQQPYKKLIDVAFINIADKMTGCGTIVKEDKNLKFIIGTKKEFGVSEMTNIQYKKLYHRIDIKNIELDSIVLSNNRIQMRRNTETKSQYGTELFYLCKGNIEQLINPLEGKFSINLLDYFIEEDLDGDGILDYIFSLGENGISLGLYLSSEANEEELARLVSVYHRGPCC